jgi:hypothetical protein
MRVVVTSAAWSDVGDAITSVAGDIGKALSKVFGDLSFGAEVDQLTIVIVAMSSDDLENAKLSKGFNKIARLRNPITQKSIRSIGLSVPINYDTIVNMSRSELRKCIYDSMLRRIENPNLRIPKDFDYQRFSGVLSTSILLLSKAAF